MKITRPTGPDIRHALRAARDSLGADAVILATRRIANGGEITAAMDFDADNVQDSTGQAGKASFDAAPLPPTLSHAASQTAILTSPKAKTPPKPAHPAFVRPVEAPKTLLPPPIMTPAPLLSVAPEPKVDTHFALQSLKNTKTGYH